ncbi:MAG: lysophospholipid acyltransferase family protein [Verrucomicrobia bacterium]|nr:lysophospholipid acyltransferase family protein [Verrucomicrobiota bacterium]
MKRRWKRIRYRLEAWGVALVAWALPKLPRRALWSIADLAGTLFHRFDARSRRIALENLRCAFPHLSERRRELIARGAARNFARTFLDLFWAPNLVPEAGRPWLRFEGVEEMRTSRERSGGAIFCSAHFGNYEWASLATGFVGARVLVVAQEFKNPALDRFFNDLRELSGHRITPRTQAMLKMLRAVKGGREGWAGAGLLADLTLPPDQTATVLRAFGGLRKCVPVLPALLSERTGAPIVLASGFPQRDGSCRVVFHPPLEPSPGASRTELAQRFWDLCEQVIRRRPSLWLWQYKHFRYRPADAPAGTYPAYANVDPAFDALLAAQTAPLTPPATDSPAAGS